MASRIHNFKQATEFFHHRFLYPDDECVHIVFLRQNGQVLDRFMSHGGRDHVDICLRSIFWRALETDAAKLLIAHNHPSGVAAPSASDKEMTKRLACVGANLNVGLMDHLIYAGGAWFSFRQAGLL